MDLDPRIKHLQNKQINELINRYYANENVNNLIKEFKINVTASHLFKLFPPLKLEETCPYCEECFIAKYPSKSSYSGKLKDGICPKCNHKDSNWCNCSSCRNIAEHNKRIALQQRKDDIIQILSLNQYTSIHYEDLDFEQKIYLGAVIREGMEENLRLIKPFNHFQTKFTPNPDYTNEIINILSKEERLLVIHPETNPDSITDIEFEESSYSYYPREVSWAINVYADDISTIELNDRLMNPSSINRNNVEKAFDIWNKIALYECIEYLLYSIQEIFNSSYNIGEKTILTFRDLLKSFSVSQIYGVIYNATNSALRFQKEKNVSKKHAINTIISGSRSYGERALSNGWKLANYHRIKPLPQSGLSKFVYGRILQVGDNGFYMKPDIKSIKTNLE